MTLLTIVRPI